MKERERVIKAFVETLQEMGLTMETVEDKFLEKYGLSEPETEAIVRRYWK